MGKRGPKPKGKVNIEWSANFAYAIGLIVADGCLYNDGRHMSLTSKDREQAEHFKMCLGIDVKIGFKVNGISKEKKYCHVQFGDVMFYKFLISIGITPAKSRTIGVVVIPDEFFFDYLRGCFDGDGTFYSYWDPRWKSSHMYYLEFISASRVHIDWLQTMLFQKSAVVGHITGNEKTSVFQLKYTKREALEIIKKIYYNPDVVYLSRKWLKIEKALEIEQKQQNTYK